MQIADIPNPLYISLNIYPNFYFSLDAFNKLFANLTLLTSKGYKIDNVIVPAIPPFNKELLKYLNRLKVLFTLLIVYSNQFLINTIYLKHYKLKNLKLKLMNIS